MDNHKYFARAIILMICLAACQRVQFWHSQTERSTSDPNCSDRDEPEITPMNHKSLALNQGDKATTDNKMGYVDPLGHVIIPAKFDFAGGFSEGMALVRIEEKYGYTDKTGRIAIPLEFDGGNEFHEGLAVVFSHGKYGYVNKAGQPIIAVQFQEALDFSEGMAFVALDGKYGVIDTSGRFVIPPRLTPFRSPEDDNDMASVFSSRALTRDAKIHFSEGLAAFPVGKGSERKWGYIDSTGAFAIQPQFDHADDLSEGLARVRMGEKFGYIDRSGNVRIPIEFDDCQIDCNFSEGLAVVGVGGKRGYINKDGTLTIRPQFAGAFRFMEGVAIVTSGGSNVVKRGAIDKNGNWVFCPKYDIADSFSEGMAKIRNDGRFGYIDRNGRIVITPAYAEAGQFSEGLAPVSD